MDQIYACMFVVLEFGIFNGIDCGVLRAGSNGVIDFNICRLSRVFQHQFPDVSLSFVCKEPSIAGLKSNFTWGWWRQSLGAAGPHQVFRK